MHPNLLTYSGFFWLLASSDTTRPGASRVEADRPATTRTPAPTVRGAADRSAAMERRDDLEAREWSSKLEGEGREREEKRESFLVPSSILPSLVVVCPGVREQRTHDRERQGPRDSRLATRDLSSLLTHAKRNRHSPLSELSARACESARVVAPHRTWLALGFRGL